MFNFDIGGALGKILGFDITPGFNLTRGSATGGKKNAINPLFGIESNNARVPAIAPVRQPQPVQNTRFQAGTGQFAYGGGGSGGGGGGMGVDPGAIAYYDDQERLARSGLSRLGNQKKIGYSNIDNSFNDAYNRLMGERAVANRDYDLSRNRTIEDNRTARNNIERGVQTQSASLKRLLGSMGAGNSSAARELAPYAVARQGNQQLGDVQTRFGRNLQSLDVARDDTERRFKDEQNDLGLQRQQRRNEFDSGLAQQEAGILEQLSNIALQREQARGKNYAQARGSLEPLNSRISALLNRVDNLGRQYARPITRQGNLQFKAPDLANYDTAGISLGDSRPVDALSQITNPFFQLLGDDERRRELGY